MPTRINVNAKPFRSSRLAVPPSPFSPLSPLTPPVLKRTYSATPDIDLVEHLPPPTQQPMRWLWACHICHRQYNLSVTRRCLDDGHYFCAGTSMVRSRKDGKKRLQRHRACGSEFDYAGWKDWGCWRRNLLALTEQQRQMKSPCSSASVFEGDDSEDDTVDEITPIAPPIAPGFPRSSSWRVSKPVIPQRPIKDCWNRCDYPSECRWGKQFGVDTPVQATFPTLSKASSTPNARQATEFVDVDMSDAPKTDFKDILTAEQQQVVAETIDGVESEDITAASTTVTPALADLANLVSRAQRRHSRSETPVSPLASNERPAVTRSPSRETLKRAVEGSIGAIAGFMGGWRSNSAPPVGRKKEEEEVFEDVDIFMEDVQSGRRKSFG